MFKLRLLILSVFVCYFWFNQHSLADWINFTGAELSSTIAEVYVEDNKILLVLEIGERDKEAFADLISETRESVEGDAQERRKHFFNDGLVVIADGVKLDGVVNIAEVRERVQRPSRYNKPPGGQKPSKYVNYVEIEYPLTKKPETLMINPPLDEKGYTNANIGFIVYHKLIPVIDFRFLAPGAVLNLDWKDPWYSKFDNPNLKRHHSSSLMSFLYIEPFEVRHEILVRLKDMENWLDLGLNNNDRLGPEQRKVVEQKLTKFFIEHNKVEIDGTAIKPIVDRVQFVKPNLTGIQVIGDSDEVEYLSAIVGIIIAYPVAGIPQKVTVDWDMFSDKIQKIPANMIDPAGPFPYYLLPEDNVLTWENYLKNFSMPEILEVNVKESLRNIKIPIGTAVSFIFFFAVVWQIWDRKNKGEKSKTRYILLVLALVAGIALFPFFRVSLTEHLPTTMVLNKEQSTFILQNLLKNVYRSFDFKNEEDVYDKLALSLDGNLLSDVYLQTRKGMEIENQGGARARVQDVEIKEISSESLSDEMGLKFHSVWNVSGSVEHWGHKHNRINQYEAEITVKPIEGNWKITNIDIIEEKRVQPI
jgi:hypothetical protein